MQPAAQLEKRMFDVLIASAIVLLASPLMLLIALCIKVWDRGPVLFADSRVGRNGELFPCYKFRSMVPNSAQVLVDLLAKDPSARAEWEHNRKLRNDPRVTPLGRMLRQASLDELPQFFNVLMGQMSLVGPRPVPRDELERYGDAKLYYLKVRPGLTGLWQVSGRNDTSYAERIALDTYYVRQWTLAMDFAILLLTFRVVIAGRGAY